MTTTLEEKANIWDEEIQKTLKELVTIIDKDANEFIKVWKTKDPSYKKNILNTPLFKDLGNINWEGETLLTYAIQKNKNEIVDLLLQEEFIDVNKADLMEKLSPLHLAVRETNETVVKKLLLKNADPDVQDNYKKTPLHIAVERQNFNIVKILLDIPESKALYIKNENGQTPLYIAQTYDDSDPIKTLLSLVASTRMEIQKQCLICLEDFHNSKKMVRLRCGHLFHRKCIREWVNRILRLQNSIECPKCKFPIDSAIKDLPKPITVFRLLPKLRF